MKTLKAGEFTLTLDPPLIMGIVNVTPDSFSDGGRYGTTQAAIAHANKLVEEGAGIVDVGGESSRPGAEPVSVEEELGRIVPVVKAIAGLGVPVSVDTVKSEVMQAAVDAGACMINDIDALQGAGALRVASAAKIGRAHV